MGMEGISVSMKAVTVLAVNSPERQIPQVLLTAGKFRSDIHKVMKLQHRDYTAA